MFCGGKLNHRIDILPERALLIAYGDYSLDFTELLNKDASCTIHQQNTNTKYLESNNCPCNICKIYIHGDGYIN